MFLNKNLDYGDACERFGHDVAVLGSTRGAPKGYYKTYPRHLDGHNFTENKLTSVALPLIEKLSFEKIYLIGWDGKGNRWFDIAKVCPKYLKPTYGRGIIEQRMHTYINLIHWNEWAEFTNMKICSLMKDDETIINQWVPQKSFKDLLGPSDKKRPPTN
jgi:hypothetical protein